MPVKNQVMVIEKSFSEKHGLYSTYELVSTDAFNKEPYTIHSLAASMGSIIEQHGNNWIEILPYEEHSFEYAVIVGTNDEDLYVYGNKIGHQTINKGMQINRVFPGPIFEFHRGDKLLLEVNKRIHIVHNISQAKLIYEMQRMGPKIRY